MRRFLSVISILTTVQLCLMPAWAQPPIEDDRYLFPIRPGERNFLSGTMGEMRGAHFHGGLDIRTGGRIGLPVYATQDGYISRMQVSAGGYGHALYLTHPDGNTSVYAHLNLFEPGLEKYLRHQQYLKEQYEVRLFPAKDLFEFKKGDIIAYSGNTGSSRGPHLHFEIRDEDHRFLNPMTFGFTEIKDNIPPILKSVAFVTRDEASRVNGSFGRFPFEVIKVNGKYTTRKPIELSGSIGMEVYHYDNQNGSYSRNGIPEIIMFLDGDTVFHQVKERMSFSLNRNILVHYDYPLYQSTRRKYNRLFREDGNELDIYKVIRRDLEFDAEPHELRLVLRDGNNNFSEFVTTVNNRRIVNPESPRIRNFLVYENHIQFKSEDSIATVYYHYRNEQIAPYTSKNGTNYFLWDLRKALPDSIRSGANTVNPHLYASIPAGYKFSFYNGDFDFESGRKTLFDTLYLRFEKSIDTLENREIFHFKNSSTPLRGPATITLKPRMSYDERHFVYSVSGRKTSFVGGTRLDDGSFRFSTRDLGKFTIAADSVPPVITPISWSRTNLKVKAEDPGSGIKDYRATLDGAFLLMRFDAKKGLLLAQPKEENKPLSGEFKLEVVDNAGNTNTITRKL